MKPTNGRIFEILLEEATELPELRSKALAAMVAVGFIALVRSKVKRCL